LTAALLAAAVLTGPIAYWEGSDFTGGAGALFGAFHHGSAVPDRLVSAAGFRYALHSTIASPSRLFQTTNACEAMVP